MAGLSMTSLERSDRQGLRRPRRSGTRSNHGILSTRGGRVRGHVTHEVFPRPSTRVVGEAQRGALRGLGGGG